MKPLFRSKSISCFSSPSHPTIRSRPAQRFALSFFLSILPTPVVGELRHELDVFRRVSGPLSLLDEINQFLGRRGNVSSRHDESGDGFAPFVVRRTHHGDHQDAGMGRQHILHSSHR